MSDEDCILQSIRAAEWFASNYHFWFFWPARPPDPRILGAAFQWPSERRTRGPLTWTPPASAQSSDRADENRRIGSLASGCWTSLAWLLLHSYEVHFVLPFVSLFKCDTKKRELPHSELVASRSKAMLKESVGFVSEPIPILDMSDVETFFAV